MTLANGWKLDAHWGHLASGYVVTSHSSQGRTVDQVFVAASSESSPAVNQAMAYVSTSRGREGVRLYTDNKEGLREAMTRGTTTLTATELIVPRWWQRVGANIQRRAVRVAAYGTVDELNAALGVAAPAQHARIAVALRQRQLGARRGGEQQAGEQAQHGLRESYRAATAMQGSGTGNSIGQRSRTGLASISAQSSGSTLAGARSTIARP